MNVLSIDTSQPAGAVVLRTAAGREYEVSLGDGSTHLVALAGGVPNLLARAGITTREVDRVAVVIGPGSFTGLRIGLSWAKGFVAGSACDLVAMGTLELLAIVHLDTGLPVSVAIDARRGEVYSAIFAASTAAPAGVGVVLKPAARAPAEFGRHIPPQPGIAVGDGFDVYHEDFALAETVIRKKTAGDGAAVARALACVAPQLPVLDGAAVGALEPRYLRNSYARPVRLRPMRGGRSSS